MLSRSVCGDSAVANVPVLPDVAGGDMGGFAEKVAGASQNFIARVKPDGTFEYEKFDGSQVRIRADGSKHTTTKDGAVIMIDANDRVTIIQYGNGDWRTFSYDAVGR